MVVNLHQLGRPWCGIVLSGIVWCGVVWCGIVWYCVVWDGKAHSPLGETARKLASTPSLNIRPLMMTAMIVGGERIMLS